MALRQPGGSIARGGPLRRPLGTLAAGSRGFRQPGEARPCAVARGRGCATLGWNDAEL